MTDDTPKAVRELLDTAAWLDERADMLADMAARTQSRMRQELRDEAARFRGRALLCRLAAQP